MVSVCAVSVGGVFGRVLSVVSVCAVSVVVVFGRVLSAGVGSGCDVGRVLSVVSVCAVFVGVFGIIKKTMTSKNKF